MQIESIVSYLGGWAKLIKEHPTFQQEIEQALLASTTSPTLKHRSPTASFNDQLRKSLEHSGWVVTPVIRNHRRLPATVDFLKNRVALEIATGNLTSALVFLLAKMSLLVRSGEVDLPILLLPRKSISTSFPDRIATFEAIEEVINDLHPFPYQHPFVIMGFGTGENSQTIRELSSDLDRHLIAVHGLTLEEMSIKGEHPDYDFKESLPDENKKTAKEICAMANNSNGGTLLLGVTDDGDAVGIQKAEVDALQLRIGDIATNRCSPVPRLNFLSFDLSENPDRVILVVEIGSIENKPCMTDERVFIRYGTCARPAKAEEIRRIVVG